MLEEILHRGVALANQRAQLILLDILWKVIWLLCTAAVVFLIVAWFGSRIQGLAWQNTGIRPVNAFIAMALARELWKASKGEVLLAVGGMTLVSAAGWFLLEAYFRQKFVCERPPAATRLSPFSRGTAEPAMSNKPLSPLERGRAAEGGRGSLTSPSYAAFLFSNAFKSVFLFAAAVLLLPVALHGAPMLAAVIFLTLAFCLVLIETLIRAEAVELVGTDLIRVTGLLGILMSFELMVATSFSLLLIAGFLNVARLTDALVMAGVAGIVVVFLTILHSYLLLVRFSAVVIMRQNAVEL